MGDYKSLAAFALPHCHNGQSAPGQKHLGVLKKAKQKFYPFNRMGFFLVRFDV
jgi:hypothetical protein